MREECQNSEARNHWKEDKHKPKLQDHLRVVFNRSMPVIADKHHLLLHKGPLPATGQLHAIFLEDLPSIGGPRNQNVTPDRKTILGPEHCGKLVAQLINTTSIAVLLSSHEGNPHRSSKLIDSLEKEELPNKRIPLFLEVEVVLQIHKPRGNSAPNSIQDYNLQHIQHHVRDICKLPILIQEVVVQAEESHNDADAQPDKQ
mmetsp:Transcript_30501/g.71172  ORF Transcript_30501/g.71172 Transcript_30501/m.71172 type:complete len:201 (-) Transcript_30501:1125-1727(-)